MLLNLYGRKEGKTDGVSHIVSTIVENPQYVIIRLNKIENHFQDSEKLWTVHFTAFNKDLGGANSETFYMYIDSDDHALMALHTLRNYIHESFEKHEPGGCYVNLYDLEKQLPELRDMLEHVQNAKNIKAQQNEQSEQ